MKLMNEILLALGELRIIEAYIQDPKDYIHGVTDGSTVVVNPVPQIIDTLIHEVLHCIRPKWDEATVRRQTSRLMNRLSDQDLQELYEVYKARAIKQKKSVSST